MRNVLAHVVRKPHPLPTTMGPLTVSVNDDKNRRRILLAHQTLAALNRQNRQEFGHLIGLLRAEIDRLGRPDSTDS